MLQDLNPNPSTCSFLAIFIYWVCETQGSIFLVLRSKSSSGKCAEFRTVAASNNKGHTPCSLFFCLFVPHIYMGVALCAHPVRGESHIPHKANREVATLAARLGWTC